MGAAVFVWADPILNCIETPGYASIQARIEAAMAGNAAGLAGTDGVSERDASGDPGAPIFPRSGHVNSTDAGSRHPTCIVGIQPHERHRETGMKRLLRHIFIGATAFGMAVAAQPAQAGPTVDAIKSRGLLICGVGPSSAGFYLLGSDGKWSGIDVDVCRAVAAAMLGDAEKVRYVPASAQQRFQQVQSGEVDMLSRTTTWTLTRDTALGLDFGHITYYDGQGFLVPKKLGIKSAKELAGATVCVQPGTTTELNLADYFRANNMQFKSVVIENRDEVEQAFYTGRCDVYTNDASGLASSRATRSPKPDDYVILPELISKEPLAPAFRHGDNQFGDIVRWAVYAMLEAEEKGITSANVDDIKAKSQDPQIKRILGTTPGAGKALGLDEEWAYRIIKQVGNYGESFDRNMGPNSPLKLDRGLNKLWTQGGLQYAPPIR
jgi:general L-amino acid transport system substrate-binding protein